MTPVGAPYAAIPSAWNEVVFFVKNNGTTTQTFTNTMSCTGSESCILVNPTSETLGPGQQIDAYVDFNSGVSGTSGTVSLSAGGATGYYNVVSATPGVPTIALHNFNGVNQDRSLCLTVGAGQAAGLSCGDLFVTHAMPGYRTMNRSRQLTLFYSSAAAAPRPTVAVWVSQSGTTQTPNSVFAKLTVNGVARDSAMYSAWSAGVAKQLVLGYDASGDASGLYPFTVLVRNVYGSSTYDASLSDTLVVVNGSTSEFGAGWWLDGVEQLVFGQPANHVLWLGGDGSAARYDSVGSGRWVRAAGPYQDTLVRSGSTYTRYLRHGIRVAYDATGHHLTSVNRAGNTTTFTWSGSPVRLTSIQVPPGVGRTTYALAYDPSANLASVADPAYRVLQVAVSGGNLTSVTDPDNLGVTFGYDAGHRLTSRVGRRGYTTLYYYTNGLHVDSVHVPLAAAASPPNDTARTTLTWWDERGLALGSPSGTLNPADTVTSYTSVDGPRTDVADIARFWVDRWGAPIKIVGAVSDTTLMARSATTGLVSRLETPVHNVWGMTYDARGNALTVVDSTHEGHGTGGFLPATTRYTYHDPNTLDSPDSVIDPEGVTARYQYNTLGVDSLVTNALGHQTRFLYTTSSPVGLLASVTELSVPTYMDTSSSGWRFPPSSYTTLQNQTTSLTYDSLGNVLSTTTPMGSVTRFTYNSYAQDTAVADAVGNVTFYYPRPMGVVDSVVQVGVGSDRRRTGFTYDADFNRLSLTDPRGVPRSWGYDQAGRNTSETDDYGEMERRWYGPSGLLDSVLTRLKVKVYRTYDAAGRILRLAYPAVIADSARGDTVSYSYDAAGHLLAASNRNSVVARQYYREGTIKRDSSYATVGAYSPYNAILQYRYTKDDQRSLYTDFSLGGNDTIQVSYSYSAGLLNQLVIQYPGATPAPDTATYTWDGLGRRQQLVTPHHHMRATVGWYYDLDGRLRRIFSTHPCLSNCANDSAQVDVQFRSYDALNRPLSIVQQVGQPRTTDSSAYDSYGEETVHIQNGTRRDFTYDASGNVVSSMERLNGVRYGTAFVTAPGHNRLVGDSIMDQSGAYYYAAYYYDSAGERVQDVTGSGPDPDSWTGGHAA